MNFPRLKRLLSLLGAHLSPRAVHHLNGAFNYLYVGWWMQRRGYLIPQRHTTREGLYRQLRTRLSEPVDFLEFGVWRGDSLRTWSKLLSHPATQLYGFDSFEGLPEDWRMAADRATFDLKGDLPVFDDPRVQLKEGWFSDTLPGFLKGREFGRPLVLHLDADLYSSTRYVLEQLQPHIIPGTLLIFDEFYDRDHELRALEEFLATHPLELECVGATETLTQVAFLVRGKT